MISPSSNRGFTLIEMIIVIIILGILVTVGSASYRGVVEEARRSEARRNLDDIKKAIETARVKSGKRLNQITGSNCSFCTACGGDLRDVPDTHECVVRWNRLLTNVSADGYGNISKFKRDPWGSPYVIDENDGEYVTNPCRRDWIGSVGPDGTYGTSDDIIIRFTMIHPDCY